MGMSQSIKSIISYNNIYDLSFNHWSYFNKELDKMEKGEEKDKTIIDIIEKKYWKDRKLYIDYKNKSKIRLEKRNRDIFELKQKLNII